MKPPAAQLSNVSLQYGKVKALDDLTLTIPGGCMVGLIGPDGVGKSSLLALLSCAKKIQQGQIQVLENDISDRHVRNALLPRIAYMPQGLGKTFTRPFPLQKTSISLHGCLDRMPLKGSSGLMN